MAQQAGGASPAPDDDVKQFRGLLDYDDFLHREADTYAFGQADLIVAAQMRLEELDREIERIRPFYEQSLPKKGKPLGRWFDEGRAYSVWLLAHAASTCGRAFKYKSKTKISRPPCSQKAPTWQHFALPFGSFLL